MAQWLSQCNTKLYQARLILENLRLVEATEPVNISLTAALQEGVLFQLILAYQCYLHELAEATQCSDSFSSLDELLKVTSLITGEMTELKKLEKDDYSWLSQLLFAFNNCNEKGVSLRKAPADLSIIKMHDTTAISLPLSEWLGSLTDLIDMQRNNSQES